MQKTLTSTDFRKMIASGARMLEINRAKVDALNVFPVPDGDTGTNMSLTLQSTPARPTVFRKYATRFPRARFAARGVTRA